jgi:hypothetical protein
MGEAERPTLRVFISSPADVRPERLIAERIVHASTANSPIICA